MVFKQSASQNNAKVVQKKLLFGWKVVVVVPKVYYFVIGWNPGALFYISNL